MDWENFYSKLKAADDFITSFEPYRDEMFENSSEDFPFFMEKGFYTEYYPLCNRNDCDEVFAIMKETAEIIRQNPTLIRYANMLHYGFFSSQKFHNDIKWTSVQKVLGKYAGIFNLFTALSALPLIRKKHIELGLDEKFMHGIADWIGAFVHIYGIGNNGEKGHPFSNLFWLRYSIEGKLFRIGRLEYLPQKWSQELPCVYRSRKTGKITTLCRNWTFDKNSMRVEEQSSNADFTTELTIENGYVRGTPVNPRGLPEKNNTVTLDLAEWELVIKDSEECPTLHIPGGGGMSLDAIRDSLMQAKDFYKKIFHKDIKIFCCTSWLFDPVWQTELPDSKISAWQRNSHLTPPLICTESAGLFFIYGEDGCDPRKRECTTALHRAICRIFDRGDKIRTGGMFILADEIENIGSCS